mgnify:CR=1 FL=1
MKLKVNIGFDIKDDHIEAGSIVEDNLIPKKSLKWLKDQNIVEKYDEKKEKELIRARNEKGHFIADDPNTKENEAWYEKQEEE